MTGTEDGAGTSWCPSGVADAPESVLLGVRSGADGQVAYLAEPVPAATALGMVPADIEPRRILRFASHCVASCANRRGDDCTLIERVVAGFPEQESRSLPRCHLRADCKWWGQAGLDACRRCPAVSTRHHTDDERSVLVADPAATADEIDAHFAPSG
ncbi:hypothetical protein ACN2WE_41170 (plasmid) [Streptomyces sp. cg28]|uniref:hypothetical protein n=1 Tax=Streptomyces sp. cg28 TaxID=3403457 RepID=UPI003B22138C